MRIPVLPIHTIGWKTDSSTNKSVPYALTRNSESMSRINDILNRGILIYFAYITIIMCVCVLSFKLYQAAQVRRSCIAPDKSHKDHVDQRPAGGQIFCAGVHHLYRCTVTILDIINDPSDQYCNWFWSETASPL